MDDRTLNRVLSRWAVKGAFLAYFVFTCIQLFRFVAWARGTGSFVPRPEAPAGLLPVGHFTSFFAMVRGGGWDSLLPAGLVIIIGAIAVSLLFKRGFCGWICPVGTVWEAFAALGRKLMRGRNIRVPRWLDLAGRTFRYVLTAGVVFLLMSVSLDEAIGFRSLPYMAIADVKTLSVMIQPGYLLVVLLAGGLSMLFGPVWCRYLCPVGGMYSAIGVASPCAVTRDAETCIHCSKCTKACHAFVKVEEASTVRDTECDGCMDCVKACPVEGCLEAKVAGRVTIKPWVWPLLVVGLWLAIWAGAKFTGNWDSGISNDEFRQIITSGILESRTPTSMTGQQ